MQHNSLSEGFVSLGYVGSIGKNNGNYGEFSRNNRSCNGILTKEEGLCDHFDAL